MVTNQKELSMGPRQKSRLLEPPFTVQVKSRTLTSAEFQTTTSGRNEARVSISMKKEDLELLVNTKHGFLVVVVFVQGDAHKFEELAIHFWFGSGHVNALLDRGYFFPDEADRRVRNLMCSLRMFPMLSVEDILDTLVSQNHLTHEGKRILTLELPQRVQRNWSASEYVALARRARNTPSEIVWRQIPHELLYLRNMGFEIGLGHLD